MSKEHDLTKKQLIFCKEYLVDMNATRAIIEAGYSKNSAETQGSRMLRNVKVKAYIDKMTDDRAERLDITADRVLEEIAHIAFFDIRNIFDGSSLKEVDKLDDKTARAISSVKSRIEKSDGENFAEVIEVKSNDKLKALDMLSKHLGLYERDNEQGKDSNNIEIEIE
ncbi:MAG: terminase small subunit [Helicobacteraceae bacterium]|nr:terminase small subunit [Helicobacteraceae bacterium]